MVKEIIIHLGDTKTGSTAIQTCLADGGYELPAGRIVYPARFNHIPLAHSLSDNPAMAQDKRYMVPRFAKVVAAFATSNADWGVISAEVFEFTSPVRLKEALDQFFPGYKGRIRLVAYVRPHHSKVVSAFAEQVKKTGQPQTMEVLFNKRFRNEQLSYHKRFSQWRAVFGDAFTLRPFVREHLVQGDVVADFLSFVTGSQDVTVTKVPQLNSSLSVKNLSMLRLCHSRLNQNPHLTGSVLKKVRDDLGWHIAPYLSQYELKRDERLKMHRDLAEKILATCQEDAVALDADFLTGAPMLKALEAAPKEAIPEPQSLAPVDQMTLSERNMIKGWADFIGHIAAADPQHFSWAARREAERTTGAAPSATSASDLASAPSEHSSAQAAQMRRRPSVLRRIMGRLR